MIPDNMLLSEWCGLVGKGMFQFNDKDPEQATLQGKPSWLMGSMQWPLSLLEDFFEDLTWAQCSAVNPSEPHLFVELSLVWNQVDLLVIKFIKLNSLAVGLWCYYKHIAVMIRKCKGVYNAELSDDSWSLYCD